MRPTTLLYVAALLALTVWPEAAVADTSGSLGIGGGTPNQEPGTYTQQITVPQGRKFVLYQISASYQWVTQNVGKYCGSKNACSAYSLKISIKGPGGAQLAGPFEVSGALNRPPGPPPQGGKWVPGLSSWFLAAVQNDGESDGSGVLAWIPGIILVDNLTRGGDATITLEGVVTGNPSLPPANLGVDFYGNTYFTLSPTLTFFRPEDFRDPASSCASGIATHCLIAYNASLAGVGGLFDPDGQFVPINYKFTLEPPAWRKGKWLPGTSTNYTYVDPVTQKADDENTPDYLFESRFNAGPLWQPPSADGLQIQTAPQNWQPVFVLVSSHDYGGVANLRMTGTILGHSFDPEQIVSFEFPQGYKPPAGAGVFVEIPIDTDCNGIADSWEGQYTNPAGGHLKADADEDGGPGKPGDGYSAFDEYRGFHYVTDDWTEPQEGQQPDQTKIKWTSTDPTQKDVFFWDTSSDSRFTTALRTVLAVQTPFQYRRVSKALANATKSDPRNGGSVTAKMVEELNHNSPFVSAVYNYALVYVDPGLANYPVFRTACGELANAQVNKSAGLPVLVYDAQIPVCAASAHAFPSDVLRAGIIAHETGHRFGLQHYQTVTQWTSAISYPGAALTFLQYITYLQSPAPPGIAISTLGRFNTYLSWTGVATGDNIIRQHDLAGNSTVGPVKVIGARGAFDSILQYGWTRPITPRLGMIVDRQFGYIMDWSPRILQAQPVTDGTPNLRDPVGWFFWPGPQARPGEPAAGLPAADLPQMCLQCKQ